MLLGNMLESTTPEMDEAKKQLPADYKDRMSYFWQGSSKTAMMHMPGHAVLTAALHRTQYKAMNPALARYMSSTEESQAWAKQVYEFLIDNSMEFQNLAEDVFHRTDATSQLTSLLDALDPSPAVRKPLNGTVVNITYAASISEQVFATQYGALRQFKMYNDSDIKNVTLFFIGYHRRCERARPGRARSSVPS